ncbi:MAG: hypothetical protein KF868_18215 [Acidobacteria bacterium]|nr:hypothetical protein [Acidobacteriota bacterium]MCW5967757.1 hypothetical protein [Blastocatellales bacterium]
MTIDNVSAVGPVFWRVNTRAEVERGDARGVSIADNGAMTLAPAVTEIFDTKQAYIWSAAADARGNIYLGTGHEGRVFRVDAQGRGALLYKTGELDVTALAVDSKGDVYAGTSPDGRVYRINSGGEAAVFFEPQTKYIWSLAFDAQGRLLVGTGDKGVIYRVDAAGKGEPFVATTQTNITALGVDRNGHVLAGTDPGGLVLRISPEGKVFTLFDSAMREVRELSTGPNGEIYALALAESAGSGAANAAMAAASSTPIPSDDGVTITIGDLQVVESGVSAPSPSSSAVGAGGVKSALYRIDSAGAAESVWDSRDAAGFAVTVDADGGVLVGTGNKGRIYSLGRSRKPMLLAQSNEAQTARFLRVGGNVFAATSNLGKLYRIGGETASSGVYTSAVRDASTHAAWGRVTWTGEGTIEIETRSGNTATPDATWSDWAAPANGAEAGRISSPPARFLQWRARLKAGRTAPRLREVAISYLPRNIAPKINSISILPAGVALQAVPQAPPDPGAELAGIDPQVLGNIASIPPRRIFQRGAVSLMWQAEDRNGDSLEYALYYRAADSAEFYPLKTDLRDNYFTIEPNSLPDGRYVFKLTVSDKPGNPADLALVDELETEPIEIDNTPPAITVGRRVVDGGVVTVEFQASDATSILRRAEYQINGGEWMSIYPVDGISDSLREEYRVRVPVSGNRLLVIALRVFDSNANVGSASVTVAASAN